VVEYDVSKDLSIVATRDTDGKFAVDFDCASDFDDSFQPSSSAFSQDLFWLPAPGFFSLLTADQQYVCLL